MGGQSPQIEKICVLLDVLSTLNPKSHLWGPYIARGRREGCWKSVRSDLGVEALLIIIKR